MTIEFLTTPASISNIAKQERESQAAIANYVLPFVEESSSLIGNVKTKAGLLAWDGHYLPFSINDTELENSYICSPYTAYIPYAMQEMHKIESCKLRWMYRKILPHFDGYLIRQSINKNIHINNWLLSTNLYPDWLSNSSVSELIGTTINCFPDHAVVLRSLNEHNNAPLIQELILNDFVLVPSRQVYIQDLALNNYRRKRDVRKDLQLLKNTPYQIVPESELRDEIGRVIQLYNQLYLQKYSSYNPHYTVKFIENMMQNPYFKLEGFRNEKGELDGVGCHFQIGNTVSMPIVGYEMKRPITDGLYRLIIISIMKYALANGFTINASSGAPNFKRLRGAKPFIEYSAVYIQHLSRSRQRMWRILEKVLTNIVVPMMRKYKL